MHYERALEFSCLVVCLAGTLGLRSMRVHCLQLSNIIRYIAIIERQRVVYEYIVESGHLEWINCNSKLEGEISEPLDFNVNKNEPNQAGICINREVDAID